MAEKEKLKAFEAEGGVLHTYPKWDDIPIEAIQNYAPSAELQEKGGFNLKLEVVPDPDKPGNFIAQYTKFGTTEKVQWTEDAVLFLGGLKFDLDSHGTLVATNLKDHNVSDPDWEVTAVRVSKLASRPQLTSMDWLGPDKFGNPKKRVYKHSYTWPNC